MTPSSWKEWGCIIRKTSSLPPEEQAMLNFRIRELNERIERAALAAGRDPGEVTLLGVTKTVDAEKINASLLAGIKVIGENRVQEFLTKRPQYTAAREQIHFIGHLQTNKVRDIIDKVAMIQSVDSLRLAALISTEAAKCGVVMPCLMEVNIGSEESKSGFSPDAVLAAAREIAAFPNITLRGLMTVQPREATKTGDDRYYKHMQTLYLSLRELALPNTRIDTLSMGMTGDFETAVRCGATMVRVGQGIYGERSYASPEPIRPTEVIVGHYK